MRLDSIVIFPGQAETTLVTSAGSQPIPIRVSLSFDRFAEELRHCTSALVEVEEGLRLPPVSDGVLYICRHEVIERSLALETERPRLLASHTVIVDVVRTYALREAERLAPAAVIASEEYLAWQEGRDLQKPAAFYGLKTVGRLMGATWPTIPLWEGPSYALLRDSGPRGLPAFLAAYLEEYANLL